MPTQLQSKDPEVAVSDGEDCRRRGAVRLVHFLTRQASVNRVAFLAGMIAMSACKDASRRGSTGAPADASAPSEVTTPRAEVSSQAAFSSPLRPGIYRIETHVENRLQCQPGGESKLVTGQDRFVVVSSALPTKLEVRSCHSPAACRTTVLAAEADRQVDGVNYYKSRPPWYFEFTLSRQPGGKFGYRRVRVGGRAGGDCEGATLATEAEFRDDRIEIQRRTTLVERFPPRDDACWSDDVLAAASGLGCSRLEQLTAVFVEDL